MNDEPRVYISKNWDVRIEIPTHRRVLLQLFAEGVEAKIESLRDNPLATVSGLERTARLLYHVRNISEIQEHDPEWREVRI